MGRSSFQGQHFFNVEFCNKENVGTQQNLLQIFQATVKMFVYSTDQLIAALDQRSQAA